MSTTDSIALARVLRARERAPREATARVQQRRLDALVHHARAHSRYYREAIPEPQGAVELARLPTLDKATLVERFDEIVCDPRLRRAELRARVAEPDQRSLHLDEYRVLATSGSSGTPGLFVYDRAGWAAYVAQFLRVTALAGLPLWEHPGIGVGVVGAVKPTHASAQIAMTCAALGIARLHALPVTLPLEQIVDGLNRVQPGILHTYGSFLGLLAHEQQAGRLRIAPRVITTSSDLLTPDTAERAEAAFGVRPFDFYATTEGLWAAHCPEHAGFHVFEEHCIFENVDAHGRPVPAGAPGARVRVTNLMNRVQPLIRYELPDVVVVDPAPCPCGRTLTRLRSLHGRSDDVLTVRGVQVHPLQFAALAREPGVREFQVVQHRDRLTLRIAPTADAPAGLAPRLTRRVGAALGELGIPDPQIAVELCARIERPASGKLQLVIADPLSASRPGRRRRGRTPLR